MVRTAVLVSGGGTNLQAIIDAIDARKIKNCELAAVLSSSPSAYALTRAENAGIPARVIDRRAFKGRGDFCKAIRDTLRDLEIELVVLAGFTFVLDSAAVAAYENRIINIHPSLIPAFCGDGYYGLRVHEAVLQYGAKVSGATAHFVTEQADAGPIILQRAIDVQSGDTPETLQRRIMEEVEWKILPEAISLYCEGRLSVNGRIVTIKEAEK